MTVKSFSPVLLEVFKLASQKEFKFDCKTPKEALKLQYRLHQLRRDMRKEQHWLTPVAEAVVISVRGNLLIAHPPDSELENELTMELEKQGLKKGELK